MIFSVVSVLSSCNLLDYTIYFLLLQDGNGGNVGFFVLLSCCGVSRLFFFFLRPVFLSGTARLASWLGFPAYFSTSTPSFLVGTARLASEMGFFCLLFSSYAHAVGFPACFPTPTPSFLVGTARLASEMGFSACFPLPTPTPWVFQPISLLSRPNHYIHQKEL